MNGPRKAMILAAGLGTRMAPLTATRPKPLIELKGKALIDYAIDRFIAQGVNFIVVNVHYLADQLEAHLKKRKDVEIHICDERDAILDTGGAVARALPLFDGEPFFTHNSDSLWVEGMGSALTRMRQRWNPETMDSLGGLKRRAEMTLAPFVWTGVQIVHPRLFDGAPKSGRFSINPLWDRAIEKGRLFGVRLDGVWIHVGTPQALDEAETFMSDLARTP